MKNAAKRALCFTLSMLVLLSAMVIPGAAATKFVPRDSMTNKIPNAEVTVSSDEEAWDRIERAYDEMVEDHPNGLVYLYQSVVEAFYRDPDQFAIFTDDPAQTDKIYIGVQFAADMSDDEIRQAVKDWAPTVTTVHVIPDDVKNAIRNEIMVPFLNNLADFLRYRYENTVLVAEGKPYDGMTAKDYYEKCSVDATKSSTVGKQALMDYITPWIIEGTFYISTGFDPMRDPEYNKKKTYTMESPYYDDIVDAYEEDTVPSNYNPEEYQALVDYGVNVEGHRDIRLILKTWINNFRQYIILAGQFGTNDEWTPVVEALNYSMNITFRAENYEDYKLDPQVDFDKIQWYYMVFGETKDVAKNDEDGKTLVGKIFYDQTQVKGGNYETDYAFDALRIWGSSKNIGGGGGGTGSMVVSHKISVMPSSNGKVISDKETASEGKTVVLTVTPEDGYYLDQLTVKTKSDTPVPVQNNGDGTYTFVMPNEAVTVTSSFKAGVTGNYNIIVYTPKNGATVASQNKANEGEVITVTTAPAQGYTLGYISVVDTKGKGVVVTNMGNGVYTFQMPASDVAIDTLYVTEGTPVYPNVIVEVKNGEAVVDKSVAPAGSQVLLYVEGEEGCDLENIKAVTESGQNIILGKTNNNLYYFTMPEEGVNITVIYKPSDDYHKINVEAVENGTVTTDKNVAKGGEIVTITPTPNEGYLLSSVTVVDNKGNRIVCSYQPDGTYTFVMPADSDVTVSAVFRAETKIGDLLETEAHGNYIIGYPEGDVRPDINITREEVSVIFYRLLRDDLKVQYTTDDVSMFTDMEKDRWSVYQVGTMAALGIVQGYPDGSFGPSNPITRAEFATIVSRFEMFAGTSEDMFGDDNGHWAERYINSTAQNGWVQGYEDGSFRPDTNIRRCEAVAIVNRALKRNVDAEGIKAVGKLNIWWDLSEAHWAYYEFIEACFSHEYNRRDGNAVVEDWTILNPALDRLEYNIYEIMQQRGVDTGISQDDLYNQN